jgi:transposase
MRRAYQTDLSDAEWSYIEPHLPTSEAPGRPRVHTLREILDAIFYIVRSGCAWRLLPHDFPPWKTAHHYFRTWRLDGTWERMHAALRDRVRVRLRRNLQPSAGIVDSQGRSRQRACRWGATWLRRCQEGQRSQAAPVGRHPGFRARSPGHERTDPGP